MQRPGDEATDHIREILTAIHAQIQISRDLCEVSVNLRQENADLREFLRETLLTTMSRREHLGDT